MQLEGRLLELLLVQLLLLRQLSLVDAFLVQGALSLEELAVVQLQLILKLLQDLFVLDDLSLHVVVLVDGRRTLLHCHSDLDAVHLGLVDLVGDVLYLHL